MNFTLRFKLTWEENGVWYQQYYESREQALDGMRRLLEVGIESINFVKELRLNDGR